MDLSASIQLEKRVRYQFKITWIRDESGKIGFTVNLF